MIDYPEDAHRMTPGEIRSWLTGQIQQRMSDPIVQQVIGECAAQDREIQLATRLRAALVELAFVIEVTSKDTAAMGVRMALRGGVDDNIPGKILIAAVEAASDWANMKDEALDPEQIDEIVERVRKDVAGTEHEMKPAPNEPATEHTCGQDGCNERATYEFLWPGEQHWKPACENHKDAAENIGSAMGMMLPVRQLGRTD